MRFLPQKLTRQPVRLPEDYRQQTLAELPVHVPVYVTPWTMGVDEEGRCWINTGSVGRRDPAGTASMLVERLPEGWVVRTNTLAFPFQWQRSPLHHAQHYEPVIALDRITEGDEA
jgi:hypothetical protein